MELVLRWRRYEQAVELDQDGRLNYCCPFCRAATFLHPGDFKVEDREVRTTGVVLCTQPGCDMMFEIAHSSFLVWRPGELDHWLFYHRWYRPELMHRVWKAHNERPHR